MAGFQSSAFGPGFQQQGGAPARSLGFEIVGGGFRHLLARTLAARQPAPVARSNRSAKRARVLVAEAAEVLADEAIGHEQAQREFEHLAARWRAEVVLPEAVIDWQALFAAQAEMLLREQEQDEEDMALALLLMH